MRVIPLALVALLLVPVASATPLFGAGVGPGGLVRDAHRPYYLFVNATQPETPHAGPASTYDCASRDNGSADKPPAQSPTDVAHTVLASPPHPETFHSASPWFPRCVLVTVKICSPLANSCPTYGYLSYEPATGRYYVDGVRVPGHATTLGAPATTGTTGTTGIQLTSDCDQCPPPVAML